ncbi:MAG: S-methyl-5'-thioadenosine phosphorylase [Armatimonadota bacterium]|nr:S-methyl-5'-thioadenosine phosphorylase [Armatimonadota bacterium]MDR7494777.1 S-methyl-5'-thioadenosine phosphorylase [Armatimonadota bacterium]MDR7499269.1 S-methyl-5'-thioadenosine phosphorylase [Armatimonadota bacterium]MDR7505093.1 S-methyl-5'-thioadenosine phosphorylase [Armatimonadota bacterium]MDR7547395.1 S-methyl-5'-thioadenosine phosphorylase [Armatimonadota bacterium]
MSLAEIGVIGGTGFYTLLEGAKAQRVETPYGPPSDVVTLAEVGGRKVAFLPRHGREHTLPPHAINYRANLWALKSLGCTRVLGPCAVGSLQPHIRPGDLVFCDQYVDRTTGRKDTFYDGPVITHVSMAEPYCPELRAVGLATARELEWRTHERGTVVVIQGPRFSTRSESRWFRDAGWEVINMTQYPEAALARELEMCYVNISLITDYDVGLEGEPGIEPVTAQEVLARFRENTARLRELILRIIPRIPAQRSCVCATALQQARL